jgi:hypothetical protein
LQRASAEASVTAGAEAQLTRTFGAAFAGVLVDGSLSPARWRSELGTVEAREASLVARAGLNLACPENFACQVGAGFGARHWSFRATPSDGSGVSQTAAHTSAVIEGDVLFGYLLDGQTGVLVHGRVGSLVDAPQLGAGAEESDSWGRPSFGLALCGALHFE